MPSIELSTVPSIESWDRALFFASCLSNDPHPWSREAVLLASVGALASPTTTVEQKVAGATLLERSGNLPTIDLAVKRSNVSLSDLDRRPQPLEFDVVRSRLSLAIAVVDGRTLSANEFQRTFWDLAESSRWLSVSAPTAAGKSRIVREWMLHQATRRQSFDFAYVVPTRALIEEVSQDFRDEFVDTADVFNLPWDAEISDAKRRIFVMTQERLHILVSERGIKFDLVFVDEAQKLGDGARGILLEQVLESVVALGDADQQIIFASPNSSNPERLLLVSPPEATSHSLKSRQATVLQNLLHVNPVFGNPKTWTIDLVTDGVAANIGKVALSATPDSPVKSLAALALALGLPDQAEEGGGNIVYANRPSDAEKIALLIANGMPTSHVPGPDEDIAELQELVVATVHRSYALVEALGGGVAFHYGNMPLLIKLRIEELFKQGKIKYLVCTSTLLEGVNLPCRNVFALNPQKGSGKPMAASDFWNLAGRAGRWGQEFQGNVVCLRTDSWSDVPVSRRGLPLESALDNALSKPERLSTLIETQEWRSAGNDEPAFEAAYSYLSLQSAAGVKLNNPWTREPIEPGLSDSVAEAMKVVSLPPALFARHPGISPNLMQDLANHFEGRAELGELLLPYPHEGSAIARYKQALGICESVLTAGLGNDSRQWQLTFLSVNWMRGFALARLIDERVQYLKSVKKPPALATTIREVMSDVEQYVRFRVPRYLSCYVDILDYALGARGIQLGRGPDINMMLELGVNTRSKASFISLGLSRTAAIAVAELTLVDDLSPSQARAFALRVNVEGMDAPSLIRREVGELQDRIRASAKHLEEGA
jgi:hypothetical protein